MDIQHHIPYLLCIGLGAAIYILSGLVKFQAAKKGRKWTLKEWWNKNGVNTLLGLVASVAIYAVTVTQWTALSYGACVALGMGLDLAAKRLGLLLGGDGTKKS
jgi:hypothetical protein